MCQAVTPQLKVFSSFAALSCSWQFVIVLAMLEFQFIAFKDLCFSWNPLMHSSTLAVMRRSHPLANMRPSPQGLGVSVANLPRPTFLLPLSTARLGFHLRP